MNDDIDAASPETVVAARLLDLAGHRTPDAIAARLLELGDRGDHNAGTCPVAAYVCRETGHRALVTHTRWQFRGGEWWTLPAPVAGFIQRHDHFLYPQLDTTVVTT